MVRVGLVLVVGLGFGLVSWCVLFGISIGDVHVSE